MAAAWLRAFAYVLLILAPVVARADAPPSVFLEDLTSPELAARVRAGATTVIIPVGGTEQNGAHMALDKEWAAAPVRVHAVNEYYRAATSEFFESLRRQGFKDGEIGPHAGLADTSLMLATDPALVRSDRMQKSEGVTGDPARASAQLG